MKQETLLMLGARPAQVPAIRSARAMGLRVAAADPDAAAPGLALADAACVADLADVDALLAFAMREGVAGAMTLAADYPMPALARLCAILGLSGPSVDAVARATNKHLMRTALAEAGVPCPRFLHAGSADEALHALARLGCDAVFKPAMSQGGRGVSFVAAASAPAVVEAAFHRAAKPSRVPGIMVEEYVDGPEFSVETLTVRGRTTVVAVTDKLTSGPPYFVELGHSQPSRFGADVPSRIARCAVAAVEAVGADPAAGHTEVRLGARGPVVMETAARMGGGFICSHLVPLSTGIDMVAACIDMALGRVPNLAPAGTGRAAAIRFLRATPGVVTGTAGLDAARRLPGVVEAALYVGPGSVVPELVDATGRVGHAIATGDTADDAIRIAEQAAMRIEVRTEARG